MTTDVQYMISIFALLLLGAWVALLFRWWFRYLTTLAANFGLEERRRRATARYPLVLLGVVIPMGTILLGIMGGTSLSSVSIAIGLFVSVAPGLIWWVSRMAALKKLGYGR